MRNLKINYNNIDFNKFDSNQSLLNKGKEIINNLPALKIAENYDQLDLTLKISEKFSINKKEFIIFGTGGSNLGSKALINILQGNEKNKIHFYDNIDPIYFENSIKKNNLNEIGFIIISKSGSTPETLSQLTCLIEIFDQQSKLEILYSNLMIITEENPSPLFKFAKQNNCLLLKHEKDIGGRFSVFSNVGIVPAFLAGLNINKIYEGVNSLKDSNYLDIKNNEYSKIANFFINSTYISNSVLMTYSDSLFNFGKWYLQLWAESIGKNGKGITAIHSKGTTDQHSQLQLYLDGPKDKFFTFITTKHSNKGLKMHKKTTQKYGLDYLVD